MTWYLGELFLLVLVFLLAGFGVGLLLRWGQLRARRAAPPPRRTRR